MPMPSSAVLFSVRLVLEVGGCRVGDKREGGMIGWGHTRGDSLFGSKLFGRLVDRESYLGGERG